MRAAAGALRAWLATLRFAVALVERLLGVLARFVAAFLAVPLVARFRAPVARFFALVCPAALFRGRLVVALVLRAPCLALFCPGVRLLWPALLLRLFVVFEVIMVPLCVIARPRRGASGSGLHGPATLATGLGKACAAIPSWRQNPTRAVPHAPLPR